MPKTKEDRAIDALLEEKKYAPLKWWIKKKVDARGSHIRAEVARRWAFRIIRSWAGPKIFDEVATNQRKLDLVHRVWAMNYYGFGVEGKADEQVLKHFRSSVRVALRQYNQKVVEARQKERDAKKYASYPDGDQEDYYNLESAKIFNTKTVNKNICPVKSGARRVSVERPHVSNGRMQGYDPATTIRHRRVDFGKNQVHEYEADGPSHVLDTRDADRFCEMYYNEPE